MISDFEIVLRFDRPVAALVNRAISRQQLLSLYFLLPPNAYLSDVLARRWDKRAVLFA